MTPCWATCSSSSWLVVLVGGGGHDQGTDRQAGDVDCHDALGALGAAIGAAAVVEGEPTVRGSTGQVGVDDDHRRRRFGPPGRVPDGRVQHRYSLRQVSLRDQRRNCDHTRVHGPNDSGR